MLQQLQGGELDDSISTDTRVLIRCQPVAVEPVDVRRLGKAWYGTETGRRGLGHPRRDAAPPLL